MGVIHKDVVQYTWTARDHLIAQAWPKHLVEGAKSEDRYVTPYRILPSSLPDCKKWKAGDSVAIPLDKSNERWAVNMFFVDGCEWVEIPAAVSGYKSIGELCAKLFAHNPNRFPALYYDLSKKTAKAKSDSAQLLFDYWKNSAYRHATIQAGFNYSNPQYLDKSTDQGGQKLRWVLAKKPIPVKAAVAPGSQLVQMHDPALDALSGDITQMRMKAARITDLLKLSERIMRGRLTLAQRFTALHTLVDVCANEHQEANPDAVTLAGMTRALEKKVLDSLRHKPIAELLKESDLPPDVAAGIRKSFGYTDNIAAEIRRVGLELVEKLTADADFAARCAEWAKLALRKNPGEMAAFRLCYDKLTMALVEVLGALQEVHTPDDFAGKLFEILKRMPDAPITDDNAIEKIGKHSALDVVLALGGPAISIVTTSVGNAAGPPSLYIAVAQLRAAKEITKAMTAGAGASAAGLKLRDEILGQLRKALVNKPELADKLEAAVKKNDQEALLRMKSEVLDTITEETQASKWWKGGIVVLQVLAIAMAIAAASRKDTIEFADVLGLVGSGASIIVPAIDAALSIRNITAPAALAKVGMGLGAFSAFLGVVVALTQLGDATKTGTTDKLALIAAGTSLLGNFCMFVGSAAWYGVAIPGLNVAGLVLLVTSTTISLVTIAIDENTPKTRKIAKAIIANIKSHPMYDLFRDEPEFHKLMATLEEKVEDVFLPPPQNNMFVVDRLREVGFNQMEIGVIVAQTGAPLSPKHGLSLVN